MSARHAVLGRCRWLVRDEEAATDAALAEALPGIALPEGDVL